LEAATGRRHRGYDRAPAGGSDKTIGLDLLPRLRKGREVEKNEVFERFADGE
jgi:hypothetical protein